MVVLGGGGGFVAAAASAWSTSTNEFTNIIAVYGSVCACGWTAVADVGRWVLICSPGVWFTVGCLFHFLFLGEKMVGVGGAGEASRMSLWQIKGCIEIGQSKGGTSHLRSSPCACSWAPWRSCLCSPGRCAVVINLLRNGDPESLALFERQKINAVTLSNFRILLEKHQCSFHPFQISEFLKKKHHVHVVWCQNSSRF